MSMIPVGSGEQSEINQLEKQIRSEYGPKVSRGKKPPVKAGAQRFKRVPVTPRGTSVEHHPSMPQAHVPTNLPNQPAK